MNKNAGLFAETKKGGDRRQNKMAADILPSEMFKWHPKVQAHLNDALLDAFETAREKEYGLNYFKRILLAGANPNAKNMSGQRPLGHAAKAGNIQLCALLLKNGANPNLKDNLGFRPLHWAAFCNRPNVCALLLVSGADADATDNAGDTPMDVAKRRGHATIMEILKAAKKN
jgi:ankyrin repeat protein